MPIAKNKRILVGVTGGIAAYKSPDLVRRLKKLGADVQVVMSRTATNFITPLTLQAVSGHHVLQYSLDNGETGSGMGHIELARWADTILIAPATANFMAKLANGQADDLLSTIALATTAEVIVAPAMNQQMWQHPATRANLHTLIDRGIRVVGPGQGDQACGEVGWGRMLEPEVIANQFVGDAVLQNLVGKKVLITAGPTWEAIDPVRGITNHSSGKMGYALAEAATYQGAAVTLISGPVDLDTPHGVHRIDLISAQDMLHAVLDRVSDTDIFIAVAAVVDYRPANPADQKIKNNRDSISINLVKNPDILAEAAALSAHLFTVGFAAETENVVENAYKKLQAKNIDMIAANSIAGEDGAFRNTSNSVTLVYRDGEIKIEKMDKYSLAFKMLEHISDQYKNKAKNFQI